VQASASAQDWSGATEQTAAFGRQQQLRLQIYGTRFGERLVNNGPDALQKR
jgi:hypothetical protein